MYNGGGRGTGRGESGLERESGPLCLCSTKMLSNRTAASLGKNISL